MSLIAFLSALFLPSFAVILGSGLGLMIGALWSAHQTGRSPVHLLRWLWESLLEDMPVEHGEHGAAQSPAGRPIGALQALFDRWVLGWVRVHVLRRPLAPGSFPITALFFDLLCLLGALWLAALIYTLIWRWPN